MTTKKPQVILVNVPPQINNPFIQQGIRDKEAAEHLAVKHGYKIIYYLAKKQKVYAERIVPVTAPNQELEKERLTGIVQNGLELLEVGVTARNTH